MNIQNVATLAEMLVATGFNDSIGYKLLQYVCFKPAEFALTEYLVKEKNILTCNIFFERKSDEYVCTYYDASFLKEIDMPETVIQGINLRELDRRMTETDWQMNSSDGNNFSLSNEASWQREKKIETIVTDLFRLSVTDDGKRFADSLKLKHWVNIPLHPMMGNLNALRSKFEVCQRFYFFDGHGISVEEAYRFLLNRWLEKKLHTKRKQMVEEEYKDNMEEGDQSANQNGLLQKKRKTRTQKIKR